MGRRAPDSGRQAAFPATRTSVLYSLHMNTIAMTPAKPVHQTLTDAIVRQLRDRLPDVLATGDGGQRVVIHIAPGHKAAKIEWPPDVEDVKP